MSIKEPVRLDLKTVSVVKEVLEDAWYSLSAEQKVRCQRQCWLNAFSFQQQKASATENAYLLSLWTLPPNATMIERSLLILLTSISLSACSYPGNLSVFQDAKFSKSGITKRQLDGDLSACRKENTVALSFAEADNEPKRRTTFAEEYLINGCMAAKGYSVAW